MVKYHHAQLKVTGAYKKEGNCVAYEYHNILFLKFQANDLELEAGIEAYQGELEGAKSGDIMDEIVNWSDEDLATNLQTELMEILKKRDTIRNK